MNLLCRVFLAVALTSLSLSAGDNASRITSLTKKVFCNCGCGAVLSECAHPDCKTRVPLKEEIAAAVRAGGRDDEILGNLEKKYGASILLVPSFQGFNVLLWIVPLALGFLAVAVFAWRYWPGNPKTPNC